MDEEVAPLAGVRGDVRHVQHHAGHEVVGEDPRLHLRAGAAHDQGEEDLAVGLVRRRPQNAEHVEGDEGGHDREGQHGAQQAAGADPAGAQGHDLAVAGQAAEGEQDAQQEGHGDGDREDARQQVDERAHHGGQVRAPRDQHLHEVRDLVQQQDEGEEQESQARGGNDLAHHVPVEEGGARGGEAHNRWIVASRPRGP